MLMSSTGTTSDAPPPAPPPFMPNVGPRLGSRSATALLTPIFASPCASPTLVVVLPSPAGVGVMADTSTSLPLRGRPVNDCKAIFAFQLPYSSTCAGSTPSDFATSMMGLMSAHYRVRPPACESTPARPRAGRTGRPGGAGGPSCGDPRTALQSGRAPAENIVNEIAPAPPDP